VKFIPAHKRPAQFDDKLLKYQHLSHARTLTLVSYGWLIGLIGTSQGEIFNKKYMVLIARITGHQVPRNSIILTHYPGIVSIMQNIIIND